MPSPNYPYTNLALVLWCFLVHHPLSVTWIFGYGGEEKSRSVIFMSWVFCFQCFALSDGALFVVRSKQLRVIFNSLRNASAKDAFVLSWWHKFNSKQLGLAFLICILVKRVWCTVCSLSRELSGQDVWSCTTVFSFLLLPPLQFTLGGTPHTHLRTVW